jgi:hypothetical protein
LIGPQKIGRCSFQDRSDFIGKRRLLQQVRGLRAGVKLHALAFTQASQGLKRLPHEDHASLHFLLFGKKIGQLLLGGVICLLIIGGRSHVDHTKQA